MFTIAEERPPFVNFEKRPIEDRAASIEAGHYVAQDVDFAIIVPQGSKDRIEQEVSVWLETLRSEVANGRFKRDWLTAFEDYYKKWQAGQEIPVNGTPLSQWPGISPAQHKTLIALNIRTVEELASCNEEAIRYVGPGARSLKERANLWLRSREEGGGKMVEEVEALRIENRDLKDRVAILEKDIVELLNGIDKQPSAPTFKKG